MNASVTANLPLQHSHAIACQMADEPISTFNHDSDVSEGGRPEDRGRPGKPRLQSPGGSLPGSLRDASGDQFAGTGLHAAAEGWNPRSCAWSGGTIRRRSPGWQICGGSRGWRSASAARCCDRPWRRSAANSFVGTLASTRQRAPSGSRWDAFLDLADALDRAGDVTGAPAARLVARDPLENDMPNTKTPTWPSKGEGGYDAAYRRFDKGERAFVQSGRVEENTREAADGLEDPGAVDLEAARKSTAEGLAAPKDD